MPDAPYVPDRLEQILALPAQGDSDLARLLQALYDRRYTGQVTFHFHAGQPRTAEFPRQQLKLT